MANKVTWVIDSFKCKSAMEEPVPSWPEAGVFPEDVGIREGFLVQVDVMTEEEIGIVNRLEGDCANCSTDSGNDVPSFSLPLDEDLVSSQCDTVVGEVKRAKFIYE